MKPFTFDGEKDFADHVHKSVPWKGDLDALTIAIANSATTPAFSTAIDLGCSGGEVLNQINAHEKIGYDLHDMGAKDFEFIQGDIGSIDLSEKQPRVVICNLTLHFLRPTDRACVLREVDNVLVRGGVFICTEKLAIPNRLERVIKPAQLRRKASMGLTAEEIVAKEIFMTENMHKVTERQFHEEMSYIGNVNTVWAHGDFMCKVAYNDK